MLALVASTAASQAVDFLKADNFDRLNLGSSWSNGVAPGSGDLAIWDATVATAVPQQLTLGADTSWSGIVVGSAAGTGITLGLTPTAITNLGGPGTATFTYSTAPTGPFANGDRATLAGTLPGGFSGATNYFVVNATATTFQLATTAGGIAVNATTTGTNVTATGGAALTLGASGIDTMAGTQPLVFPGAVVSSAAQNWNLLSGVTINGGFSGLNASGNDVTLNSGTLTIGGRGMTLSNLVVNPGATVSISSGGSGVVALNGGTFNVNGAINEHILVMAGGGTEQNTGGNRTWSGNLFGSGPLTVVASSTHTWTGVHSNYTGTLTLQGTGALRLSSVSSVSAGTAYNFNGGTMNPNATGTFNLGSLGGASGFLNPSTAGPFAIGALNTDTTFGGVIGGAGNIIKVGTGTLTLSGANTFSGATIISNGVLQIDDGSGVGKLGSGSVTNLSRLVLNRAGALVMPNLITGTGSLTNIGSGKVTLTASNNYTGATYVMGGTLAFGSASQLGNTIFVSDGATIGAVPAVLNATVTHGSVDLGTGAGCSYEFDLGTFANPTSTVVTNTGNIAVNGNVTVNVLGTNAALTTGSITLLRYATRSGSGSFVLGSLPVNVVGNLNDDTVNKRVVLNITSVTGFVDTTFRWVGDSAGIWDIDNLGNQVWKVVGTGQTTNYTEGAAVLFDDTATGNTNIDLLNTVNPASVVVNNTNKIYTFGGVGSISGSTGLTKSGPGTLIITNTSSYAGQTAILGGKIVVADETGALGGGGVTNNGMLVFDRTAATNVVPNVFNLSGQFTGSGSMTLLGMDSTNTTIQVNVGTADGNPYSGGTTISNAYVNLVASPSSDATRSAAKATGLGTGQITFLGNSLLELEDFGVGNNSAQAGNFAAPLNVPAGQVGTLRTGGRGTVSGALTGAGTFNLVVSYIRNIVSGDYSTFTGQLNVMPSPNLTGNQYQIANALGMPVARVHLAAGVTMGGNAPLPNNSLVPIGELSGEVGSFINSVGETPRTANFMVGGLNTSSTFAGNFDGPHALTKVGTGTLTLVGTNNYTGSTTVSNGVLALVGDAQITSSSLISLIAPGILNVASNGLVLGSAGEQTLQGNGTIHGSLTVAGQGTVAPGSPVGMLTVTNGITLGGELVMELDRSATTNSDRLVSPTIAAGGSLTVTNIGAVLQVGDTFQLFSQAVSGSFAAVNLPTNDPVTLTAYTWTNKVAINGTIAVLTAVTPPPPVNTTPTNIVSSVAGGNLTLSWPADRTGWTLQVQTNSRAVGLNTNWFGVAGSSSTNQVTLPIGLTNGAVFYRLVYP
jgi:fibronectin-binding autotransporter adhesin